MRTSRSPGSARARWKPRKRDPGLAAGAFDGPTSAAAAFGVRKDDARLLETLNVWLEGTRQARHAWMLQYSARRRSGAMSEIRPGRIRPWPSSHENDGQAAGPHGEGLERILLGSAGESVAGVRRRAEDERLVCCATTIAGRR